MFSGTGGRSLYLRTAGAILALYAVVAIALVTSKDFTDEGPLSFRNAELSDPLAGGVPGPEALDRCFPEQNPSVFRYKVVGGIVDGLPYYACYEVFKDNGSVFEAVVLDARSGERVRKVDVIKRGGAWPWVGVVKSGSELFLGGIGVSALSFLFFTYYRRRRPGQPTDRRWWQSQGFLLTLGTALPVAGWLVMSVLPGVSPARKQRAVLQSIVILAGVFLGVLWILWADYPDVWGLATLGLLTLSYLHGMIGGRRWLRPEGFGLPEILVPGPGAPSRQTASPPPTTSPSPAPADPAPAAAQSTIEPVSLRVQRPDELASFRDVGGMADLKRELKETFGLLLAFAGEADAYRIRWNGILLYGPPGVGKTFVAKAVAGEFGLNFIHVSTGDLVSAYRGESARNVKEAVRLAACNIPCVLFFDEFDSVAQSREDSIDPESRRIVNQLLQSLEEYRNVRELIVIAATNDLGQLDTAVIRPGRFDRHIRVDLPDAAAREAIFLAQVKNRPAVKDLDLAELARRSEGLTPAAIAQAVEVASLAAFREAAAAGELVQITMDHLLEALEERGGKDRPMVEEWTWDGVVLPNQVKRELMSLQLMVEEPERARVFGVEPPTGVLLTGPPGTGKTTIAKVLAAQAQCSFYPVSAADVRSKWLGESERNIRRLFQRAQEHRPSIIFIDEIDAITPVRGEYGTYDPEVNQLLVEIDGMAGQRGVLVVAATNRSDQLDPALTRGGRLSRMIEIPLPDLDGRRQLLRLYTEKMPLVGVELEALAHQTEHMSGADIKALCQQAALQALIRSGRHEGAAAALVPQDFAAALAAYKAQTKHEPPQERAGQYL